MQIRAIYAEVSREAIAAATRIIEVVRAAIEAAEEYFSVAAFLPEHRAESERILRAGLEAFARIRALLFAEGIEVLLDA